MRKFILPILIITAITLSGCGTQNTANQTSKNTSALAQSDTTQYELSELQHATVKVEDMWCAGCATGIEYSLKNLEGVTDARISFEGGDGEIIYNPKLVSEEIMKSAADPYTLNILETKQATSYSLN